jgi:hypothetical protein
MARNDGITDIAKKNIHKAMLSKTPVVRQWIGSIQMDVPIPVRGLTWEMDSVTPQVSPAVNATWPQSVDGFKVEISSLKMPGFCAKTGGTDTCFVVSAIPRSGTFLLGFMPADPSA